MIVGNPAAKLSRLGTITIAWAKSAQIQFELTPEEFEALVTSMQRRIQVRGTGNNIFSIQYTDTDRNKAQDVVAAVLSTFVEGAIGAEGDDTEVTEEALAREIKDHEERLRAAEARLAEFKKNNLGYMPDEFGDYYGKLQAALNEVGATQERIRLLTERRGELQRQIEGEEPVFGIAQNFFGVEDSGAVGVGCSYSSRLTELRGQLSELLVDFTERHPRVVALRETIEELEHRCAAENESASAVGAAPPTVRDSVETNPVYQNLRIQLSNTEVELAEARAALSAHQATVTALRADVDKITEVETELKQLNRDYGVIQGRHQELLRRWEELQAKVRLDAVTDRVQFRVIERPFAPTDPVGPNKPMLLMAVLVFAIGSRGAVAFGLNELRPVFFTRRSIERRCEFPVLGSITLLQSRPEIGKRLAGAIA
jgi:polysaccharide chain length determinant protein (PEP-CTERM system associated)